jgi:protein TonB
LWIYGVSIALHVGLAAAAVFAPKEKKNTVTAISLSEAKPKPKPHEETPPPPPPPPPPPAKAKAKAAPVPVAAAAKVDTSPTPPSEPPSSSSGSDGFADLGLSMGNGGPGGMAVAAGRKVAEAAPQKDADTTHKVRALAPKHEDTCDESPIKPKPKTIVRPTYTEQARAGQIEGAVRVEITVDETGKVIDVKVLRGLGYGLDEAALAAAKQMTFEPGTRCGKPAVTKLTTSMRFSLE